MHQKFPKVAPPANSRMATSQAVDLSLLYQLTYNPDQSLEQVRRTLLGTGAVEYVEPVYLREPFLQPNDPSADSAKTAQYYLKLVKAYGGWEAEQGSADIMIGILDTGTRLTHQELKDKVKYNTSDPIDGIDNDNDGYIDNYQGWDFADNDNDPSDDSSFRGHGTAVAGVAAAATNNAFGIAGVGYKSTILPLKVFSSKENGNFNGYEAIVYAADKGCKVINLSWGGEGRSQYEQDIINYAVLNKNVVIVAAGGNTDRGKPLDIYPAAYENVLSVGGTNASDVKVAAYTYSYKIDLTAPSQNILSLSSYSDTQLSGGWNGTSFATPIVSGAAALVRARFPELNALQVMERLRVTTDDIYQLAGNQPYLGMLGKGRLNIKKALSAANVKAVRCNSFAAADRQQLYAGATAAMIADFTNFLAPVGNLQVTLTSLSPYLTVTEGSLALGSLGTLATVRNTLQPFKIKVAEGAPNNISVVLRLDFSDGAYSDFQYVTIFINPDFVTLNANQLAVTVNSKGNLGYNGLNRKQGEGVTYKNSSSLLFEGGLLLATDPSHVSDNIRNDIYQSDGDFIPTSTARLLYNTPQADQEVRAVMQDNYPSDHTVGVKVKHVAYAWSDEADQNFIILEYQITNRTDSTIKKLYTGLFADWDIGDHTTNIAEWDQANALGYVHSTAAGLPYTGITLLTKQPHGYYAIDNIGGGDSTFAVEDGFTSSEKFRSVSGGVARRTANGGGPGNNVSQVVSGLVSNLAPGETGIIAFAVLAGDNLQELQQQAAAAQQKYRSIKTGPAPVALADTACAGSPRTWRPGKGNNYNFYADANKSKPLGSGATITLPALTQPMVLYAANADSLYESEVVPAVFSLPPAPIAAFEVSQPDVFSGTPVTFINTSINGGSWRWSVNNTAPITTKDLVYTFPEDGTYEIKLLVTDRFGCTQDSISRTLEIMRVVPTGIPEAIAQQVQVYPNPARGYVRIRTEALTKGHGNPQVKLVDMLGHCITPATRQTPDETQLDLARLSEGVYLLQITYEHATITKRLVVLKP